VHLFGFIIRTGPHFIFLGSFILIWWQACNVLMTTAAK